MLISVNVTLGYMASTKTPTYDLRSRAREVIRDLVERDFGGNQTAAAAAWRVRQATISNALNPRLPAAIGTKLFEAVARHDPTAAAKILGIAHGSLSPSAQAAMARLVGEGVEDRVAQWAARTASEVSPDMPATLTTARVIASLAVTVSGLAGAAVVRATADPDPARATGRRQR